MKRLVSLAVSIALVACARNETTTTATQAPAPATSATTAAPVAEKTHQMNGVVVSRDPANNTVNIDNEDVPGVMAPMKMDYELRGAGVDSLPPDGSRVTMTLHEQNGTYWVTDVKPRP